MQSVDHASYSIRRLGLPDLAAYKAIRLEALQLEPGMFGNSYAYEAAMDEQAWVERVTSDNRAVFGLYFGGELIGITGIVIEAAHPSDGYMTQSYIRAAHRGKGLSRLLYEERLKWARAKRLERLIIGHRESNSVSKAANQHYGFTYTHRAPRTWPDSVTEDMVYYQLPLL